MPKNVQCKRCIHFKNDWCVPKMDSPDPDIQRDCQYFHEKTNADRIRAMTDEEFAKWLTMVEKRVIENTLSKPFKYTDDQLKEDWLDWLKQPAESEVDNDKA